MRISVEVESCPVEVGRSTSLVFGTFVGTEAERVRCKVGSRLRQRRQKSYISLRLVKNVAEEDGRKRFGDRSERT